MDQVVTLLTGIAESAARASIGSQAARDESGMTDREWWDVNAPILDRLVRAEDYPIASRVGQAAGQEYDSISDPERTFVFTLDRIVDGLEVLLKRRERNPDHAA
jgi:hypothetical protein